MTSKTDFPMFYNQDVAVRFPKGVFAMATVYSFTGAAILVSIIFSLLLFLSIDDDPMMMWLFGGLAIIFELGKFFAWYEFGERRARRNYPAALSALLFYLVLALISIGGSIGGINSATNKAQGQVNVQQSKINAYNMQIEAIEKQIALNNDAAQKYIEMERIATGVTRIQKENEKLRKQQQDLAMERDSIPVISQGSVLGLIDGLAKSLGLPMAQAQMGLVVILSVLLDFFAAFFVGLIGEENRFRNLYRSRSPITIANYQRAEEPVTALLEERSESAEDMATPPASEETPPAPAEQSAPEEAPVKSLYEQAVEALQGNQVVCSKRAMGRFLKVSSDEINVLFKQLMAEGLISQKPNKHYQWQGAAQS